MDDLDLRALSVKCPLCGASIQKACFNKHEVKEVPHVARIDRYLRLKEKEFSFEGAILNRAGQNIINTVKKERK